MRVISDLAKITVTITNGRRIVHTQGRDARPRFERRSSPAGMHSYHTKRVCVLNEHEAERLEHYHESFPCTDAGRPHTHYSRAAAEELVRKDEARWVGEGMNVLTFTAGKTWQPLNSGGMTVMQMVPGGAVY